MAVEDGDKVDLKEGDEGFIGTNCKLSAKGFYGVKEIHDVAMSQVEYFYEMLVDSSADIDVVRIDLDKFFSESVLRSVNLFESCYTNSGRQLQNSGNKLDIIAMSSRPHDKESVFKTCSFATKIPNTYCMVMEGAISLFYNENTSSETALEAIEKEVVDVLEAKMHGQNSEIMYYDEDIKKIRFLTSDGYHKLPNKSSESGEVESGKEQIPEKTRSTTGFSALIALLVISLTTIAVVLTVTIFRFARKKKFHAAQSELVSVGRNNVV